MFPAPTSSKSVQLAEASNTGLPAKQIDQSELIFSAYPIAGSAMLYDTVYDQLYGEQVVVLPMLDADGGSPRRSTYTAG